MEQSSSSLVLSVIKTEVPLESDDPACQNFLLQQYGERIEKLSQQDKLSKFCMDAGFLSVVENGEYFMISHNLVQWPVREYTLPREEEVSKKVIHLLRHSQEVHREEDGAVHFWRMKENLQNQFPQSINLSDDRWKACLAAGGVKKEIPVLY